MTGPASCGTTPGDQGPSSLAREEDEERAHFHKVQNAFRSYKKHSMVAVHKREEYLNRLPVEQQRLLRKHGYQDTLDDLKQAVEHNFGLITEIMKDVEEMFENVTHQAKTDSDPRVRPAQTDMDKVQSTLKQLVRDWSSCGAAEREQCYSPILTKIRELFPDNQDRPNRKILVPGAGLGRLAFEIAKDGFECQGNEFSLFMLFASNFVLNRTRAVNCFKIFPYIHNFCNNMDSRDQLATVTFPDVDPNSLQEDAKFSMAAGNFLEVYDQPEYAASQDSVVTCFFIDCAHNVLQFIQVIHKVLKQGGVWINLGPLLYHFSEQRGEDSIEPDYKCLRAIIQDMGFQMVSEEQDLAATYDQNPRSMLQYQYKCVFFTAKKC